MNCGGYLLQVEISQGRENCVTRQIEDFSAGKDLEWSSKNGRLGNCSNFDVKNNVLHEPVIYRLKTKSYDAFCPQILSLELKNRTYHTMPLTFVSEKMVHWHDKSHNEMIFKPLFKWTPSQSCEIAYKGIYDRLLLIKCSI